MLKSDLRKKYKEKRKGINAKERAILSEAILNQIYSNFDLKGKTVSVFLPIDRFNEVLTWQLLKDESLTIGLPVLVGNDELTHVKFENMAQIKISDWGIPEPKQGETIVPADFDLVFVPLLAVDLEGYRVGYGKGYYDRFLVQCRSDCKFIGLSYFDEMEQITDLHEGDKALHYLITPSKLHSF